MTGLTPTMSRHLGPALATLAAIQLADPTSAQELYGIYDGDSYTVQISGGTFWIGQAFSRTFATQDHDGDGVADFVILAPGGRCTGEFAVHSGATGARISTWNCSRSHQSLGGEVGDLDGDGDRDLVFWSGQLGSPVLRDALSGEMIGICSPPMPVSGYGTRWVDLGDINGDGYDDIAVSASERDRIGIHLGPDGALMQMLPGFLGGSDLANIGDLDGDGIDDLIISDAPFNVLRAISTSTWQPIYEAFGGIGSSMNPYWGTSIDGIGDLDGDGVIDLVVGEPGGSAGGQVVTRGAIEFLSGIDGDLIRRVDAPVLRDPPYHAGSFQRDAGFFGWKLDAGGDVNGDGFGDVIIGSPYRYFHDFPQRGADTVVSGRTGAILADLELWDRNDPLSGENGFFGSILGDLDGDGLSEFAVGSVNDERGGPSSGRIWIFHGFDADAIPRCNPPQHSGGERAQLALDGSLALSVGELWLRLLAAPSQTTAVFFATPGVQTTPMGAFGLCVGGPGTLRVSGAVGVDANGFAEIPAPLTTAPFAGAWLPGTAWTFQSVFRDTGDPSGVGRSNAIVLRWGP